MTTNALTAGIAELLSMQTTTQQAALSELSQYNVKAGKNKIPKAFNAHQDAPAYVSYFHGGESKPEDVARRVSVASTRAGGSSADSLDLPDMSDVSTSSDSSPRSAARRASSMLGTLAEHMATRNPNEPCRSTLKIANIPRRCGKDELVAAIDAVGFGGAYDFFYLPLGLQSKKNHGYAFINFKDNSSADVFTQMFQGYPLRAKLLDVTPAPLQGLAENVEHFSKTSAAKSGWIPNVILKV